MRQVDCLLLDGRCLVCEFATQPRDQGLVVLQDRYQVGRPSSVTTIIHHTPQLCPVKHLSRRHPKMVRVAGGDHDGAAALDPLQGAGERRNGYRPGKIHRLDAVQHARDRRSRLTKIISWNLLRLTGATIGDVIRLAKHERPDLFLMQEATAAIDALPQHLGGFLCAGCLCRDACMGWRSGARGRFRSPAW